MESRRRRYKHSLPLLVTGFGTSFALHFTERSELRDYRDLLEDDPFLLQRCLIESLREGLCLVPDGRMYVSTVAYRGRCRADDRRHGPCFAAHSRFLSPIQPQ